LDQSDYQMKTNANCQANQFECEIFLRLDE
jgi:hypothetical protein